MDALLPLFAIVLTLFLIVVLIVLPIWTFISVKNARRENADLANRLNRLESELRQLKTSPSETTARPSLITPAASESVPRPRTTAPAAEPSIASAAVVPSAPPPTRPTPPAAPAPSAPPTPPTPPPARQKPASSKPAINWEQFMGVKLFAWIGGLALFLGVAFFVKYSFENNLIPPEVRVALGFLTGAGLMAGGMVLARKRYAITGQTLCATGTVTLYAVTFACHALYHFAFFGPLPTFALMVLITATAFLMAVRLDARVVAVLGILGGFLTPILISTGHDNPPGFFGYLALLDIGLLAVALNRRWHFLAPLGAAGTVLMQIGWLAKFFAPFKFPIAIAATLGFIALFLEAVVIARRRGQVSALLLGTAVVLPFVAFGYAWYFMGYPALAAMPGTLFAFILLADAAVFALAWMEKSARKIHPLAGGVVFMLLAYWTQNDLTPALLPWALAIYLAFAALHTVGPILLARRHPDAGRAGWSQLCPALTLLLMLGCLARLPVVPLLFWPGVLLLDLLAVWLAVATASLIGLAAVLVLTLGATAAWVFKIPVETADLSSLLLVIGGFALLFFIAGLWVVRRLGDRLNLSRIGGLALPGDLRAHIPSLSVLLPFALLVMVVARLPLANPSPVFGLALLLVVLALGLSRVLTLAWLPAAALIGVLALENVWQQHLFTPAHGLLALGWYLLFYAIFTAFPFLFRKAFADQRGPWIVAALAGALHFPLIHQVVASTWPNNLMGLLPAVFALPALACLVAVLRTTPVDHPQRLGRLAWFGGAALFFITLVFPIQFDRQWITIGWAIEGAALLWLFHRVPHPGLRLTGVGLLVIAFIRLAFNPAVLSYHERGTMPLFNWYLYAYGVAIIALFAGARLLAPPRDRVLKLSAPALLGALGTVLLFLLLNIEIADFFSPAASTLTFEFSGNLARDMTYTIAWALFALGLLIVGIWKTRRAARYAALGLLSIALLKLFFHDLASLGQLYRIGALIAVAVIAMLASFVYQRFLPSSHDSTPSLDGQSPPPPAQ